MKVLIVEDEVHAREALGYLIDWGAHDVSELLFAEDGEKALDILEREQPAIMFCDMRMPKMDGVALLNIIKEREYDIKIIVISGYDDFRYTRAAIQAHGVDYILKPFKKHEVQQAFDKAVALCRMDASRRIAEEEQGVRVREADRVLSEQKLYRWLSGQKARTPDVLRTFEKLGISGDGVCVDVILPRNTVQVVDQMYAGDYEIFAFELNTIAREIFHTYRYVHLYCPDTLQWILISSAEGGISGKMHQGHIRRLVHAWEHQLGIQVFAASGEVGISIRDIPKEIRLRQRTLLKSELIHTDAPGDTEDAPLRFADEEVLMRNAVPDKNKALLSQVIGSFCQKLHRRKSLRLEELQLYTAEANLMIRRFARQSDHPTIQDDPISPWINDLQQWQETLMDCFYQLMEDDANPQYHTIDGIRDYIHKHYDTQITLSHLSERFFLSPQYISKIYKERFGKTVITEITELRIQNAKAMLRTTDKPIAEIALSLGFNDENYFGKVFKKHTGMSPNAYRIENTKESN